MTKTFGASYVKVSTSVIPRGIRLNFILNGYLLAMNGVDIPW